MKILTKQGYIDAVALFFELSDEQLEYISKDQNYYHSRKLLEEFNNAKGDNAHFFGITNTSAEPLKIESYYKELLKVYKSISWWDRENKEFKIIRRK